jgi:hypothetical protein
MGTSSIDWAQLSRLLSEEGDRVQSPKRFLNKKQDDNVQKFNNCISSLPFLPSEHIMGVPQVGTACMQLGQGSGYVHVH